MRYRALRLLTLSALFVACSPAAPRTGGPLGGGGSPPGQGLAGADADFPQDWKHFDVIGEATRQENGELRVLYANATATGAPYPAGSVLVKAHHRLDSAGAKGALFQLSVMIKGPSGWTYQVFDPKTGKRGPTDADVCIMCHTQRQANDFVFTER